MPTSVLQSKFSPCVHLTVNFLPRQALNKVAQQREQALAAEHLDNLWAKGRNYKKRESEKCATQALPAPVTIGLVSNPGSANTVQVEAPPDGVSGEEVSTSEETSGDLTTSLTMNADNALPIRKDKSVIEQYAHLFGDSKDGDDHLPGIGFSPLGTPRPSSAALDKNINIYQARDVGGPELVRLDNEDLLGASANSQSTSEASGQSLSRFGYYHKPDSSSQRMRRALRLLAHRKSKSTGGSMDGWNGLEVDTSSHRLSSFFHSRENSPVRSPGSESRWRSLRKSHSPDVSPVPTQADISEHTQSTKLHCQVRFAHFCDLPFIINRTEALGMQLKVLLRLQSFLISGCIWCFIPNHHV